MENFNDVKVGDTLIWYGSGNAQKLVTVEKVNKTTFVVDRQLFNKSDGWLRGRDRWSISYCSHVTPEMVAKLKEREERSKMLNFLTNYKYGKLSTDKLRELCEYITTKIE